MRLATDLSKYFDVFLIEKENLKNRNEVYGLWYDVYYKEMKRNVTYADHNNKCITDSLEPHSYIFAAKMHQHIAGSFRINFPSEGPISYYNSFYELDKFPTSQVAIGTRYMVHPHYRGNYLSHQLMGAAINLLKKKGTKWLIIDCSPPVYKLFEKLGFTNYLGEKISAEYGKVKLMKYKI